MSKLTNKIEAHDRKVSEVLENKKYTVDYFQREYNWQRRHIEQLINDLTGSPPRPLAQRGAQRQIFAGEKTAARQLAVVRRRSL